jgi:hypothetical protein
MSNTVQPLAAPALKILCYPFAVATKGSSCPTISINARRNSTNRRRTRIAPRRCTTEKKTTRPARSTRDKPWSMPPRRTRRLLMRINGRKTRRRNRASSNLCSGEAVASRTMCDIAHTSSSGCDNLAACKITENHQSPCSEPYEPKWPSHMSRHPRKKRCILNPGGWNANLCWWTKACSMVTPAIGADADFQTGQRATFRAVQRRMKNFFCLRRNEKSDLLSMFAQTVRSARTSGWSFLPKFLQNNL